MPGDRRRRFEQSIVPHMDAAFDLARWLARDRVVAEEAVQEAFLRAWRHFDAWRGEDARAWLLAIVRNTCFSLLARQPTGGTFEPFDEALHAELPDGLPGPPALLEAREERTIVHAALAALPEVFREAIVLRELHDLSYKEIAAVAGVPIGTVMSRLARGRALLAADLAARLARGS